MRRVRAPAGARAILFGETPYGWRLSKDRSKLVMDKDEQRLVGVVRHMYFVEKITMRAIVVRLAEMGVVNRRDRPFTLSSVWAMIHGAPRIPPESTLAKRVR